MPQLKVIILCGQAPRHLYVANRLCREAQIVAIVHETGREWTWRKMRRALRPGFLVGKLDWWLRRRKEPEAQEARFFFGDHPPRLQREDLRVFVPHINHPDLVGLLDRLNPDLVAVFGTTLIRKPLLGRGRLGMVNLHGGLSPHYRGADCTFWALYNGEPDQVGCTLHYIDAGIDTGRLIAHVCPEVRPQDDEHTLFWRAVRDGAEVYADLLQRLARGECFGQPQMEKGRLFQVKDRTRAHERQLHDSLARGLLQDVHLPPRVTWFRREPT